MNEVKVSTQMKQNGKSRLSIKMDMESLGLDWQKNDIIRVMSYKDSNTIVLKRVGKKAKKTVAHTLTTTGRGNFAHDLGLYVSHKPSRFKGEFVNKNSVNTAVRFLDDEKTMLQIYLPNEIFA